MGQRAGGHKIFTQVTGNSKLLLFNKFQPVFILQMTFAKSFFDYKYNYYFDIFYIVRFGYYFYKYIYNFWPLIKFFINLFIIYIIFLYSFF